MHQPDPKHPSKKREYQREPLSVQNLPTGCRFDPERRAKLLHTLAKRGMLVNARDAFPPPQPTPSPVTLLYPFLLAAFPAWSYGLQSRGDCMAWSATHSIDILMAANIILLEKPEIPRALASIEAQYALMRVEAYNGGPDYGGDGASPDAAADSVLRLGTLHRLQYLDAKYDLREYDQSGGRSGDWGRYGLPDELEPIAKTHFVQQIAQVTDFDTAVELLSRGVPISNAHPQNPIWTTRDADGFGVNQWHAPHAMNYIGYRLGPRPGLLKTNTGHGNHVSGPMHPTDCPSSIANCAAWEDANIANGVLSAGWSWAYSDYIGFPKERLQTTANLTNQIHNLTQAA